MPAPVQVPSGHAAEASCQHVVFAATVPPLPPGCTPQGALWPHSIRSPEPSQQRLTHHAASLLRSLHGAPAPLSSPAILSPACYSRDVARRERPHARSACLAPSFPSSSISCLRVAASDHPWRSPLSPSLPCTPAPGRSLQVPAVLVAPHSVRAPLCRRNESE